MDPISDMLTRVRNAVRAKHSDVSIPFSGMKLSIAKILEKEGYVESVEKTTVGKRTVLKIRLGYNDRLPRIHSLRRVSKPGGRVYAKSQELPIVLADGGIAVVSTPNGLMTNKEARARHLGGEVICEVY